MRAWEDANLPLSQSRVAFDLFFAIAHNSVVAQPMTLKELFFSLRYSERGVRYVLEQFVEDGWCEVVAHSDDKRRRFVMPTDRMRRQLAMYEEHVHGVYLDCFGVSASKRQDDA